MDITEDDIDNWVQAITIPAAKPPKPARPPKPKKFGSRNYSDDMPEDCSRLARIGILAADCRPITRSLTRPIGAPPPPAAEDVDMSGYNNRPMRKYRCPKSRQKIIRDGEFYSIRRQSTGVRYYQKKKGIPRDMHTRLSIDGGAVHKLCIGANNTCLEDATQDKSMTGLKTVRRSRIIAHTCFAHTGVTSTWDANGRRWRYRREINQICQRCSDILPRRQQPYGVCEACEDY